MNKRRIDQLLPKAAEVLNYKEVGIAKEGKVDPAYRSQISSFGSAVKDGSLLAAVARFNQQDRAKVDRNLIIQAINILMEDVAPELGKADSKGNRIPLFDKVKQAGSSTEQAKVKEQILDCVIALKLAMNLYDLSEGKKKKDEQQAAQEETR